MSLTGLLTRLDAFSREDRSRGRGSPSTFLRERQPFFQHDGRASSRRLYGKLPYYGDRSVTPFSLRSRLVSKGTPRIMRPENCSARDHRLTVTRVRRLAFSSSSSSPSSSSSSLKNCRNCPNSVNSSTMIGRLGTLRGETVSGARSRKTRT